MRNWSCVVDMTLQDQRTSKEALLPLLPYVVHFVCFGLDTF